MSRPLSTGKGEARAAPGLGREPVGQGEQLSSHRRRVLIAQIGEAAVLTVTGPGGDHPHLGETEDAGGERRDNIHRLYRRSGNRSDCRYTRPVSIWSSSPTTRQRVTSQETTEATIPSTATAATTSASRSVPRRSAPRRPRRHPRAAAPPG